MRIQICKWNCGRANSLAGILALTVASQLLAAPLAHSGEVKATYGQGWLEQIDNLPVLHMKGSEREMGEQYGYLMGDMITRQVDNLRDIAMNQEPKITKWIPKPIFNGLRRIVGALFWTSFSSDVKDHIEGIVEGASLRPDHIKLHKMDIAFINTLIDLVGIVNAIGEKVQSMGGNHVTVRDILTVLGAPDIKANCDSFAAWGPRTVGGKTFQTRNTDIDTGYGIEKYPLVIFYQRDGKIPVVSASFVGMVGIFAGMNAHGLALGQVWAFSKDVKLTNPWHLQVREIFMESRTAREAVFRFGRMKNTTYGSNFVIADAGDGNDGRFSEGFSIETSAKNFEVFEANDPRELELKFNGESVGLPIQYATARGDLTLSPTLRARSTSAAGPEGDPRTTGSYQSRYKGQIDRILAYEKAGVLIGHEQAETISRETAMRGSSLQASVYANTDRDMWVSYAETQADGTSRQAYDGVYHYIPFHQYLSRLDYNADSKQLAVSSWMPESRRNFDVIVSRPERKVSRGWFRKPQIIPATQSKFALLADREEKSFGDAGALQAGDVVELREGAQLIDRTVVR